MTIEAGMGLEFWILSLLDFGLAHKRLSLLYLRCWMSGSNSVVECQLPIHPL